MTTASHLYLCISAVVGAALLSTLAWAQTPAAPPATLPAPHNFWVYVGNSGNDGIGLFSLDTEKGTLTSAGIAVPARSPGFLTIAPDQKTLYAVLMKDQMGSVQGFSIDHANGKLTSINAQPCDRDGPAFVAVDPAGRNVLIANYGSATVASFPIDAAGKLSPAASTLKETGTGPDAGRQSHAYAHSINCDPSGGFAISCDLGADKLFIYKLDTASGKLTPNDPAFATVPPGSGPRHLVFHPNGRFVYVVNEMGGTVAGFSFDSKSGALTPLQVITTLKNNEPGNNSAELQIDSKGKFLYASNRLTTDYLTQFSIDSQSGKLTLVGYQDCLGKTPRNFRLDPTGQFLVVANQDSDTLVLFRVDATTGKLTPVGKPIPTVHTPNCIKFVAASGG